MFWEDVKIAACSIVCLVVCIQFYLYLDTAKRMCELKHKYEQIEQRFDKLEKIIIDKALEQMAMPSNNTD